MHLLLDKEKVGKDDLKDRNPKEKLYAAASLRSHKGRGCFWEECLTKTPQLIIEITKTVQ